MPIRMAINGFGRMGRLSMRLAWDHPDIELVHVNEAAGDAVAAAQLLEYDSIHGRWTRPVQAEVDSLLIEGQPVSYSTNTRIEDTDWGAMDLDVVLECTGSFRTPPQLQGYLDQGVPRVAVSAPIKDGGLNVVMGINQHRYDPAEHRIVSAASCTTNCIAPVIAVIAESFGIARATITTIHDLTNTQCVLDSFHRDSRRARASGMNLIPTSTGSATAITDIFPELTGKLTGIAVRVPLANASLTDCVFVTEQATTSAAVNEAIARAAGGTLRGILGYETKPLVSSDYRGNTHSAVIDGPSTTVSDGTLVKLLAWYDNEMGYVHRLIELAAMVGNDAR